MGLTIIYWVPIIFFGSVYIYKFTSDIAKQNIKEKEL